MRPCVLLGFPSSGAHLEQEIVVGVTWRYGTAKVHQGASRCIKVHQGAWDHTLNQGTEATPEIASWLEWSRLQPTAVNSCTRLQCAFPHRTINPAARRFIARVWTISLYVIVVRPMIWRTAASSVKMNTVMLSVLQQMLGKWEQ